VSTRRRAIAARVFVALTTLVSAGLLAAAILVPAPPTVLPFVMVACLGCSVWAGYQLASAVDEIRDPQLELRRELDRLPETEHPLGL
jgi:hypothetical protein